MLNMQGPCYASPALQNTIQIIEKFSAGQDCSWPVCTKISFETCGGSHCDAKKSDDFYMNHDLHDSSRGTLAM